MDPDPSKRKGKELAPPPEPRRRRRLRTQAQLETDAQMAADLAAGRFTGTRRAGAIRIGDPPLQPQQSPPQPTRHNPPRSGRGPREAIAQADLGSRARREGAQVAAQRRRDERTEQRAAQQTAAEAEKAKGQLKKALAVRKRKASLLEQADTRSQTVVRPPVAGEVQRARTKRANTEAEVQQMLQQAQAEEQETEHLEGQGEIASSDSTDSDALAQPAEDQPQEQPEQIDPAEFPLLQTTPEVTGGAVLRDYQNLATKQLRKLRWDIQLSDWFPPQRDVRIDRRFWTLVQASLYESARRAGISLFRHTTPEFPAMSQLAGQDVTQFFSHIPGLTEFLEYRHSYIEEWVRVFYATLYVSPSRLAISFMFMGRHYTLYRQSLAQYLGLMLSDHHLHTDVYGDAQAPRRTRLGGTILSDEAASVCFRPRYLTRAPRWLTPVAGLIHRLLRHSLLPRLGYKEGITSLQLHLLRALLSRQQFCIVDFLIAEMEDSLLEGLTSGKGKKSLPFGHFVTYLLSRLSDGAGQLYRQHRVRFATHKSRLSAFSTHRGSPPTGPLPPDADPIVQGPAPAPQAVSSAVQATETAPQQQWPADDPYETDSSDDSDADDFERPLPPTPPRARNDFEAGISHSAPPPPVVSTAPVQQPSELTTLLQAMMAQQAQSSAAQLALTRELADQRRVQTEILGRQTQLFETLQSAVSDLRAESSRQFESLRMEFRTHTAQQIGQLRTELQLPPLPASSTTTAPPAPILPVQQTPQSPSVTMTALTSPMGCSYSELLGVGAPSDWQLDTSHLPPVSLTFDTPARVSVPDLPLREPRDFAEVADPAVQESLQARATAPARSEPSVLTETEAQAALEEVDPTATSTHTVTEIVHRSVSTTGSTTDPFSVPAPPPALTQVAEDVDRYLADPDTPQE